MTPPPDRLAAALNRVVQTFYRTGRTDSKVVQLFTRIVTGPAPGVNSTSVRGMRSSSMSALAVALLAYGIVDLIRRGSGDVP